MELALLESAQSTLTSAVARDLQLEAIPCSTERFPDGETHVLVGPVRDCDVYLILSTGPPVESHVMELCLIADACERAGAARLTAVIPYFGYARQDRRTRSGEAVGARVVGKMLWAAGVRRAVVVDPHVPALEAVLPMPTEVISVWDLLTEAVRHEMVPDSVVVAPDGGAVKLADRVASSLALPMVVVRKRRVTGEAVSVTDVVGDVRDRPLILVDDMVSTAGTAAAAIEALLDRGAVPDILIAAPHGLLVGEAFHRIRNLPVRRLVLGDTLALPDGVPCGTTVVPTSARIAETISRLHGEAPGR